MTTLKAMHDRVRVAHFIAAKKMIPNDIKGTVSLARLKHQYPVLVNHPEFHEPLQD